MNICEDGYAGDWGSDEPTIIITIEAYDRLRRLLNFADMYLDDMEPFGEQYESDKEEITQAQEVIQEIDGILSEARSED